jgi:hypothetical protein
MDKTVAPPLEAGPEPLAAVVMGTDIRLGASVGCLVHFVLLFAEEGPIAVTALVPVHTHTA